MKLSMLAVVSSNVVVVALCGLWSMAVMLPLMMLPLMMLPRPVHAQINLKDLNRDRKLLPQDYQDSSSISNSSSFASTNHDDGPNRRRWLILGIGSVLLLTGIGVSVWTFKRRRALAIAEENERIASLTPTAEQRRAATAKVARIPGRMHAPYRAIEYLRRLQQLPATVLDYPSAMTALKAVYMLCRDTERREPLLCRLLTENWRTLDGYREEVPEAKWLKSHTDEFRIHLVCITLETEALIHQSRRPVSSRSRNREGNLQRK